MYVLLSEFFNLVHEEVEAARSKGVSNREKTREGAGGDSRRRQKHSASHTFHLETSKGNSRNYGDFSEEFREIDGIPPRGHRLSLCRRPDNSRWDVADKERGE